MLNVSWCCVINPITAKLSPLASTGLNPPSAGMSSVGVLQHHLFHFQTDFKGPWRRPWSSPQRKQTTKSDSSWVKSFSLADKPLGIFFIYSEMFYWLGTFAPIFWTFFLHSPSFFSSISPSMGAGEAALQIWILHRWLHNKTMHCLPILFQFHPFPQASENTTCISSFRSETIPSLLPPQSF